MSYQNKLFINRSIFITFLLLTFFSVFSYGQEKAWEENVPPAAELEESDLIQPETEEELTETVETTTPYESSSLEEARLLAESGQWLDAQKSYRSFLTQEGIPEIAEDTARSELAALNMKILFSPIETDDSLIYVVKTGDNLYNIAKKYNTTVSMIQKSSQLKNDLIRPGMKLKITKAKFSITIDKSDNALDLYSNEALLKTYRVGTGANNSTPTGSFTIDTKLENPTWYKTGAVAPPGSPENILGTRWLGFSLKGYGIHGTTLPETIGHQASSGCIRMLNQDVEELYSMIPTGTQVTVKD